MENFLILFIVLFAVMAIIGKIEYRNTANPTTLFCGLWTLILLLYTLRFRGLYDASGQVISIVVLGVMSFFCGAMLKTAMNRGAYIMRSLTINEDCEEAYNYKVMILLNVISLIVLAIYGVVSVRLLLSGRGFDYIRQMYMSDEGTGLGGSRLSSYIMTFFLWPWNYTIIPLTIISFFDKRYSIGSKRKQRGIFWVTSIVNIALFVLVTAGRISLVYLVMYFILFQLISAKSVRFTMKQKLIVLVLAVVMYFVISYISESRGSPPLYINGYFYICGCMPFFTHNLDVFMSGSNVFTYGFASLRGIWMLVLLPLSKIIGGYPELYTIAVNNSYVQNRIYIAPNVGYNAFTTPFYFFFIDGGYFGVIILSFIYGYFATNVYINMHKKRTPRAMLLYFIVAFGLLMSMVRCQFSTFRYVGAFIYAYFCFKKIFISTEEGRDNE